ncbi:MAG: TRAP transporter large permease subunit [Lewinellaceae bacterium]|nr:TRAP transporter large permease subunit [Lewinellaceae bacterium]
MEIEIIALLFFISIFIALLSGYPVAFVLGGLSIWVGWWLTPDFLDFLPLRVMGTIQNYVLLSVPMFIFMGLVLEKSGIAEGLLVTMSRLFGKMRGGLAISVVLVGTMLAASTGIVGATVITMGLISLPIMLKSGYSPKLATGIIAGSGTLGQIIPPSVVLILLGSVLNVSIGDLFKAALIPGIFIALAYIVYILILSVWLPKQIPAPSTADQMPLKANKKDIMLTFILPFSLIVLVLGSIFFGIASATEASAVGAVGAILMAVFKQKMDATTLKNISFETMYLTSMVFMILVGATAFSLVFRGLGGDKILVHLVESNALTKVQFLVFVMVVIFIAGFFIDFIEIVFIIIPIVAPIFAKFHFDPIYIGILVALNIQTSFLTPPFGFALFYLKGVAPAEVSIKDIYKGVIPFIIIQLFILLLVALLPNILNLL